MTAEEARKIEEAESSTRAAENKMAVIMAKGKIECIDDIAILAEARMTEDCDFSAALEKVKKERPQMFEDGEAIVEPKPAGYYGKAAANLNRREENDKKGIWGKRVTEWRRKHEKGGPDTFFPAKNKTTDNKNPDTFFN